MGADFDNSALRIPHSALSTPEFLIWSLEYRCPVRGLEDGRDPERAERHLRAARAASDALAEGRVIDGLALAPPLGFRLADALTIYGGAAALEQHCRHCPANVSESGWAGCFGMTPLPPHDEALYRLLIESPLSHEQAALLGKLLAEQESSSPLAELCRALDVTCKGCVPLHVRLFPRGRVEGMWWRLDPHCPRCKAPWPTGRKCCGACQYVGHPAPDKKRRARGTRPYYPLDRLLGTARASAPFVGTLVPTTQTPPPPAPPDSLPAD
jgi:hypothetical protein